MRKHIFTSLALLLLFLIPSQAAQNWSTEQPGERSWVFSSDEGGTTSYLGVDIADVTTERLSALKLKEEKGVEVTMVDQDAPAGKAGIKEHDVILTMNGTAVESEAQLRRMIHEVPPGRVITLGLSRDGSPMTVKVQLADKHNEYSIVSPKGAFGLEMPEVHVPDIELPAMNMVVVTQSARSGLMVENITPQLGEFFGVKDGNGVLVRSVDKGSRADKAGFRAGDIIVKVNDQSVHDTSDFTHAVKSRNGNSVSVGVVRDKKEQTVNLTLPERKESSSWWQEETFEEPLINADSGYELTKLQYELARIRPQAMLAYDTAAQQSLEAAKTLQKSLCEEQKKVREQTQKQREELRKDQPMLRNSLERMRQSMQRTWADL
jgi:membrane-associated protease RseP (regulator of RpoE activity)